MNKTWAQHPITFCSSNLNSAIFCIIWYEVFRNFYAESNPVKILGIINRIHEWRNLTIFVHDCIDNHSQSRFYYSLLGHCCRQNNMHADQPQKECSRSNSAPQMVFNGVSVARQHKRVEVSQCRVHSKSKWSWRHFEFARMQLR